MIKNYYRFQIIKFYREIPCERMCLLDSYLRKFNGKAIQRFEQGRVCSKSRGYLWYLLPWIVSSSLLSHHLSLPSYSLHSPTLPAVRGFVADKKKSNYRRKAYDLSTIDSIILPRLTRTICNKRIALLMDYFTALGELSCEISRIRENKKENIILL